MAPRKSTTGPKSTSKKATTGNEGAAMVNAIASAATDKNHLDGTNVGGMTGEDVKDASLALVVTSLTLGQLVTNAKDLHEVVLKKLELYKTKKYSADNIAEAKKDRATLNTAIAKLNDDRLEYQRKWLEPFEKFKGEVDGTIVDMKKVVTQIDTVVKDQEKAEKDDKKKSIEEYFTSKKIVLFTLDMIFKVEWLNKGSSMKSIQAEIDEKIKSVDSDLAVLDRLNEPAAREHYLTTLDLASAITEADRLKENREKLEAYKGSRAPASAPPQVGPEIEEAAREADRVEDRQAVAAPQAGKEAKVYEFTLFVQGSYESVAALKAYMDNKANGITYKKVEVSEGDGY